MTKKTVLNWSSGKDAALAYHLLSETSYQVHSLLTTVNSDQYRVVMHGVRQELLERQAEAMEIPLRKVLLQPSPSNDHYEYEMRLAMEELKAEGVQYAAFGDIFLEELKTYREQQLHRAGVEAVFPLWKQDTRSLIGQIEDAGVEAIIVCVDKQLLGADFLGRKITRSLLADLPENVDPCGENGEFHSFVYNAPYFKAPIHYTEGETVLRSYGDGNSRSEFLFMDIF